MLERLAAFVAVVKESPPDFILLQETTRISLEKLVREMNILGYKKYIPDNNTQRSSLEVIFSKHPIKKSFCVEFRISPERRGLTCVSVDVWGKGNLWLITSQFDVNTTLKKAQIVEIPSLLKKSGIDVTDYVIFGGDTGILEYQKDFSCPENWLDSWYEAGTNAEKYTADHESNPYVPSPHKDRPDRVWFKDFEGILCEECRFFGNKSDVVVSSHYGVLTSFTLKG